MTPEQLKKGKNLTSKIEKNKRPIEDMEGGNKHNYIKQQTMIGLMDEHNSNNSIYFRLKADQIEVLRDLVMLMAKKNLKELEEELEAL